MLRRARGNVRIQYWCRREAAVLKRYYHSLQIFFLCIGREPTTWPANNGLQIMSLNYSPQPSASANNWSARHWQITILFYFFSLGLITWLLYSSLKEKYHAPEKSIRTLQGQPTTIQGHPTTVFCQISGRGDLILPRIYAWERLKLSRWTFHSRTIFKAYLINSLRFSEV